MSLAHGTFVRLKTDPTRAGILQPGERVQAGRRMMPVQFPDGTVSWLPELALEAVPAAGPALSDRFASGRFVAPDWLRRALARLRVTGRLSDLIYSMEATETEFYAYQFKPVLKLLNSPTDALLIADEVGLGKTIEAGLIWTELRARLDCNRLLVLCPRTLCEKWRIELEQKFGVDARIVNAADLLQLLTSRTSTKGFAVIASMQALRPPRSWRDPDSFEEESASPRQKLARLLDDAAEGSSLIDLLIVDEAHHMRNPSTMLYQLGELTNAISLHRVFLSATPIHLRNRDLFSLLKLIDPDMFEFESTLEELISANSPIVAARDLLLRPDSAADDIMGRIDAAQENRLLRESKTLQLARDELQAIPLDRRARAALASRLEQANQLANYITRTRRRDVQEFRVHRVAQASTLTMHSDERTFYEAITFEVAQYAHKRSANERFLLSTPQRLLTSSPAAASRYWFASFDDGSGSVEETDDDLAEVTGDARPLVARLVDLARRFKLTERLEQVDTKYNALISQLRGVWKNDRAAKVVIFSSFKITLEYLQRRLKWDRIDSELLHGSVSEPREVVLKRFKDGNSPILLSSDVGSEGIDLQFCWIVVNYDLPWNPMRVEQRIGRIDRLGQRNPKINILNLIYSGTIDEIIYERLYKRLGLVERALGEFESVLGEPIREMTIQLLDSALTEAQKAEAVDRAAQVVANLKEQEEQLEAEAGSLVKHGDYILQKITEGRDLNRWLRAEDVLVYVRDRLCQSYPGCSIEADPPGSQSYHINLSPDARESLTGFVARRGLRGKTRLIGGSDQQRYEFSSSVVRQPSHRVEVVSQLHPLVRFAEELDRGDDAGRRAEPVAAFLRKEYLKEPATSSCAPAVYAIGVRHWICTGTKGRIANMSRLSFSGARVGSDQMLLPEAAEAVVAAVAERGELIRNIAADDRLAEAAAVLRNVVLPDLDRRFEEFVRHTVAELEDRAAIRMRALERHRDSKTASLMLQRDRYSSRAAQLRQRGEDGAARRFDSLATATEGKLRKLHSTCQIRFKEIEAEKEIVPEDAEVACLFVEIAA